jgi:hypothetical protein
MGVEHQWEGTVAQYIGLEAGVGNMELSNAKGPYGLEQKRFNQVLLSLYLSSLNHIQFVIRHGTSCLHQLDPFVTANE